MSPDLRAEKQRLLLSTARVSNALKQLDIGSEAYRTLKLQYDTEVERITEINQELSKEEG